MALEDFLDAFQLIGADSVALDDHSDPARSDVVPEMVHHFLSVNMGRRRNHEHVTLARLIESLNGAGESEHRELAVIRQLPVFEGDSGPGEEGSHENAFVEQLVEALDRL